MKYLYQVLWLVTVFFGVSNAQVEFFDVFAFTSLNENIFAGTQSGGYVTTNYGTSWTRVSNGLPGAAVRALASMGSTVFAGTYGQGVYRSTNNGTNWTASTLSGVFVYAFGVSGTNLFADKFRSSDSGTHWSPMSGLPPYRVSGFAVSGSKVFAAIEGGVFLSTDNGTNWTLVNSGLASNEMLSLVRSGTSLFVGTGDGVFRSTSDGATWTPVNAGLTDRFIYSLCSTGTSVFAGTYFKGIFRSTDNGANWIRVGAGMPDTTVHCPIWTLASFGTTLLAGTGKGIFRSTNNGESWVAANNGLTAVESSIEPPHGFRLEQNSPNPFNPTTIIRFRVPHAEFVTLQVLDVLGREVMTLVHKEMNAGEYERTFDGTGLASGVYLYQLRAGSFVQTRKLVLLR